jgi:hypothetical protein
VPTRACSEGSGCIRDGVRPLRQRLSAKPNRPARLAPVTRPTALLTSARAL